VRGIKNSETENAMPYEEKNRRSIQPIIEEYQNRNPIDRLYLFLQYPGLRQVFDQIDHDEIDTEFVSLANSQKCHMTPQAFVSFRFSGLYNFIKSIFGNNINTKNKEGG
jgi:hypothetical protein